MRRFAMLAVSLSVLLGLSGSPLFAQGDAKKESTETKTTETKTTAEGKTTAEVKKDEVKKDEPLPPIPPEVEKKLEAARRAVAEAIVAAQDAGLVKSSIDPPPILDILITGRANDESTLKAKTGVSPEVFGAWYTGYGKTQGIVPQNDVRITQPSTGLKTWYDQRASRPTTRAAIRPKYPAGRAGPEHIVHTRPMMSHSSRRTGPRLAKHQAIVVSHGALARP